MQSVDSAAVGSLASERAKWGGGGSAALVLGKRSADESRLNDDDRFAKRLNLLSLEHSRGHANSGYYLPIAHAPPPPQHKQPSRSSAAVQATNIFPPQDELMQVDDTRDRVYIHNLDAELADVESAEKQERLIFLPDIERHFSKIPERVLRGRASDDHSNEGQEIVLYGAPKSLTVDEEHDSVRKAIIESRQRARELAALSARSDDMSRRYGDSAEPVETAHGYGDGYGDGYEADMEPEEVDAMDMS